MKLKKEELLELFNSAVDNSFYLYECSQKILFELDNSISLRLEKNRRTSFCINS